ncbi:lipoprotein signal peptidase [Flammeovirgaceae bacterium SG7u.111]|nr:lipoprotein signal peptidase [Flammeovirgaceae bacterium SG7u.132]WPO36076.1 lipoprotein signal peptidase [Flammeovirgaceae bacterium SG7u.111]
MKYFKYYLIAILVIAIDQASKLLVHFNMEMGYNGQISVIGDWFKLYYVLNPGIAFGINFESEYSKFFLTLFRLLASGAIGYYLYRKINQKAHWGLLVCMALILAGAIGNVVDSVFYGVFLEGNAIDGAFTPWFHGQVIDMLYFPLIEGTLPAWLPVWGGESFLFFSAIFNIADSAIFLGVVSILIFQSTFLPKKEEETPEEEVVVDTEVEVVTEAEADDAETPSIDDSEVSKIEDSEDPDLKGSEK